MQCPGHKLSSSRLAKLALAIAAALPGTGQAEAGDAAGYDAKASKAHDEEVGEESPLAAAYRAGKADAMGGLPG